MGLDYVLMALVPALSWLFVGRLISGITAASVATAGAYIADVSPPEERAENFGIGCIPRPALGGILGSYNMHYPFWVAAAMRPFEFCPWILHSA
jgi:DHA1 family tetracycline resistance protein-like MFS transporter